ncbi:MAG: hypothetical protein U1E05_03555 [Patescibacteria group bacterium]|nr:hypothetical protein [Patescibacteria group bacterium]
MIAKQVRVVILVASLACLAAWDHARGQQSVEPDRPSQVYSPLDAANDSYEYAEQGRQEAIARQLELMEYARQPRVTVAVPYVGAPAIAVPPGAARRALRRAYSQSLRDPYWPGYGVMIGVGPRPALPYVGAMPYSPPVRQPQGHERIWTGPNSYIYKPVYPAPFYPAPTEAARQPASPWDRTSPPWDQPFEPQVPPVPEQPRSPTPAAPRIPEPPTAPLPGPQEL